VTDPRDPFAEPEADDAETPARISARSVAIWGARATGGLVAVGVAVVVAIGSVFLTPPTFSVTPPETIVEPEPASQTLVCPGPLLRLADESGQNASDATALDTPVVRFSAASGELTEGALAQSDAGTGGTARAPRLGFVTPVDGEPPIVAGVQSDRAASGNVVGYTTASCQQPALRSWIIGGSTQLGRTSILTISNPSSVEATVDLDLYGELGAVDAVGLEGIVIPAGSQRVIPVNGFSLEQRAPVIGISSTGGNVAAFLQESIIRTLVPGGVDLSGQQSPSTELVIPGVLVQGEQALAPLNTTPIDQDDTMPTLRLFAPDAGAVTATVALVPDGSTLAEALAQPREFDAEAPGDAHIDAPSVASPMSFDVTIADGAVAEVPIPGIAPGTYTVVVTAAEPLVGAVRASRTGSAGIDFAWYSPAGGLGETAVISAAELGTSLWVANTGAAERTVTLGAPAGEQSLVVPAGGAVSATLTAGAEYSLSGMSGLHAAIVSGGNGLVAQSPLLPQAPLEQPVRVHS